MGSCRRLIRATTWETKLDRSPQSASSPAMRRPRNSSGSGVSARIVLGLSASTGISKSSRNLREYGSAIEAITKTISDLGDLLFLFFVISQFVAYFNYSNVGTIAAIHLANLLKGAELNSITLLLVFLLIGVVLCFPLPNIIPKWAIIAPVFVPLFLKLGIEPDAVLAAYRVSDSPPNVINPLLPHFALVVGFARRWQKDAGVGTLMFSPMDFTAEGRSRVLRTVAELAA